jgi:hypothetical protein
MADIPRIKSENNKDLKTPAHPSPAMLAKWYNPKIA